MSIHALMAQMRDLFRVSNWLLRALAFCFCATGAGAAFAQTLSVTPTVIVAGSTVTVRWSGISAATGTNWIGLYTPGAPSQNHNGVWMYVNCTKTAGAAFASGSCAFPVPSTTASGSYELRLHASASWTSIAKTALTVTGGGSGGGVTTVSVSSASAAAGSTVTVSWSGIASPTGTNWIGLYTPGAASQNHNGNWMYVNCTKTAGAVRASGNCAFPLPSGLVAGAYEIRLHASASWTAIATTALTITGGGGGGGGTVVSVSPASVAAGGTVTVSWSGIASPTGTNWIGLYTPGAASQNHNGNWMYVNCTKTAGAAAPSGSCPFPIPSTLAAGTYQIRLHASASWTAIATSGALTITGGVVIPPPPTDAQLKDAARLLIQASYGPTTVAIKDAATKGPAKWIDDQFALPQSSHYAVLRAIELALPSNKDITSIDETPLMSSLWKQAIQGQDQLRQRVAFALSQILVVSFRDGDLGGEEFAFASYMDMLGRNAFGNFRALLEDVTLHHAMGFYLDMMRSEKEDPGAGRQPNENYPREILQLFTIGLHQLNQDGTPRLDSSGNPIPTYDQDVVLGFAKAFSGWSVGINPKTDQGFYNIPWPRFHPFWVTPMQAFPSKHSTGTKQLLNGAVLPAGQTPEKDLKDALDNIFNHPNVGPFISKQLIQRLVTSNPSPGYVSRVAAKFNNNGSGVRGDMKAVIKAILLDSEARDRNLALGASFGKQREPIVRLANLVRAFKGASASGEYSFWWTQIIDYGLGQQYFYSPSVFNFFAPDYAPQGPVANAGLLAPEFQITTDSQLLGTSNTMYAQINWGYGFKENDPVNLNLSEFIPAAADPAVLVDQLDLLLTGGMTSTATRNTIIGAVSAEPAANAPERVRKAIYLYAISPDYAIQK